MRQRSARERKTRILPRAAGLLYPRRCVLCDCLLDREVSMVCRQCRSEVQFIAGPTCCRCGRPLEHDTDLYCAGCGIHPRLFLGGFAPFVYDGPVKEAIIRLKYSHRAEYAQFFAQAMYVFGKQFLKQTKPQALIPVPVHRERRILRGYNQAELLAEQLSDLTGIPVMKDSIRRIKGTAPQKELGIRQRQKNLSGAFQASGRRKLPERILIVDDIFTTGSTADAVTAVLLRAGAQKVYFACAAIAAQK